MRRARRLSLGLLAALARLRRQQLERDKQVDRILQLHKENGEVGAVMRAELDHDGFVCRASRSSTKRLRKMEI